jgi:hypothetical protein
VKVYLLGGPSELRFRQINVEFYAVLADGTRKPIDTKAAKPSELWLAYQPSTRIPVVYVYRNFFVFPKGKSALFYFEGERSPKEFQ